MDNLIDDVEFCRALADVTRQKILRLLLNEEKTVTEVVKSFNLSQPTVSHHLDILNRSGLLSNRREGKQIFYRTNQDIVVSCCGKLMAKFNCE